MTDVKQGPADGIDLSDDERSAIDRYDLLRQDATHYELLSIAIDADRKTVRDAYFALSKRFHPDVYFKREIGPYRERIEGIFRSLTRAYDVLGNPKQRAAYDQLLKSEGIVPAAPAPAPAVPAQPEKAPVSAGAREVAQQQRSATQSANVALGTAPTQAVAQAYPPGVVVPPSLRTVLEAPQSRVTPAPASTPPPGVPVIDEAVRARAMEAMARRLGAGARKPSIATAPAPAMPSAQQLAEERAAKIAALVAKGEEAQKHNDLMAALESFRGAQNLSKDDAALNARVEAVTQLIKMQKVAEHIEKAKEAGRARNFDAAAMHWEKAWEGRREDSTLLLNAAEILSKAKEYKRAAELAQRALAIDPKLTKAHYILAVVFTEAGLRASARSAIEHLARLEPTHPQLKELKEKLGPLSIAEQFGLRGSR